MCVILGEQFVNYQSQFSDSSLTPCGESLTGVCACLTDGCRYDFRGFNLQLEILPVAQNCWNHVNVIEARPGQAMARTTVCQISIARYISWGRELILWWAKCCTQGVISPISLYMLRLHWKHWNFLCVNLIGIILNIGGITSSVMRLSSLIQWVFIHD